MQQIRQTEHTNSALEPTQCFSNAEQAAPNQVQGQPSSLGTLPYW